MDSTLVRQLIRHRLVEGRLPRGRAVDIWDAPGEGQTCDGCDDPIARDQMMIWGIASQDCLGSLPRHLLWAVGGGEARVVP